MTKEDLIKLKEQIMALSEEEKNKRDLYLKQLNEGTLQGPPVGYPSIDKPWLRHFKDEELLNSIPEKTCYEMMYESNIDHKKDYVFEYLEKKYTYEKFFDLIEKTKASLEKLGVQKGEVVTVCSVTTPEVLALFYALNRLGAVPNFIDVRYTSASIKENLIEANSNKLFILDLALPKIDGIINETNVDKVVSIGLLNGASVQVKAVWGLKVKKPKGLKNQDKYTDWNDFFVNEKSTTEDVKYEKDYPAAIVHTGGTTGIPKGVVLSNDDFNGVAYQTKTARTNERRKWRFLNIMPPFIAYGLGLGLYAPVVLGWETIIIPSFDQNEFSKLLRRHKPNGVMGVPVYWDKVMSDPKMKKEDLSYLEDVLVGGDKVQASTERKINEFLAAHNSDAVLSKGYSMTEASALATFSNRYVNKPESVGIPLAKTTVSAFAPNTQDELECGELGELCIKSPNLMKEYFCNSSETEKVKQKHVDGYWIHSGDIGYVDKDGVVFVKDRMKRMIVRSGFKVFPNEIERVVSTLPFIRECAVIGIPDVVDGNAPKLFITIDEKACVKNEDIEKIIYDTIENSNIPPYFKPVDIEIIKNMPLTGIGKVDYRELSSRHNNLVLKK